MLLKVFFDKVHLLAGYELATVLGIGLASKGAVKRL